MIKRGEERAADECADRARQRSELLRPFYGAIVSPLSPLDKALFPSFSVYRGLPSMRPFWEPEQEADYTIDQSAWDAAAGDRLADLKEVQLTAKAREAHTVASAFLSASVPFDGLVELLAETVSARSITTSMPGSRIGEVIPTKATDAAMDPLLSHFLARFACTSCATMHHYPDIKLHQQTHHHGSTHGAFLSPTLVKVSFNFHSSCFITDRAHHADR